MSFSRARRRSASRPCVLDSLDRTELAALSRGLLAQARDREDRQIETEISDLRRSLFLERKAS